MTPEDPIGLPGYDSSTAMATGGSSTVWRAREVALNRWVAIKVLSQPVLDPDVRRRFDRELALTGQLSGHPSVVTVYASGFTRDGRPFIASEWCPSGSLADVVAGHGPLSAAQVAAVGVKVAGALAAAHAQSIHHRDVKPANVMITAYGEAALADFGIAASGLDATAPTNSLTPVHAAPESLQGTTAGPPADVWGLGSTLWSALTGAAPFAPAPGQGVLPTMMRILNDPPPELPADVPAPLADLLHRMLAKDALARPSAEQAAAELGVLAAGAAPLSLAAPAAPPVAPSRVVAEPLDGELTVLGARRQPAPEPLAPKDDRRRPRALVLVGVAVALAAVTAGLVVSQDDRSVGTPAALVGQDSTPTPTPTPTPTAGPTVPAPVGGATGAPALPVLSNGSTSGGVPPLLTDTGSGTGSRPAAPTRSDTTTVSTSQGDVTLAPPAPAAPAGSRTTAPAAPTGVTATGGDGTLSVSWRQGSNGGSTLTRQTLIDSTGKSYALAGNAVGFLLDNQTNDRELCVTLTATNDKGTSPASTRTCGTPRAGAPGQPGEVAVSSGDATVAASWGTATDGSKPVTGYVATLSPGGAQKTTDTSSRTATFTGLTNGTSYTVSVVARTSTATGPARGSATTVPSRVPDAPRSLAVKAGAGTLSATWAVPASDGGSALTAYDVYLDGRGVKALSPGTRAVTVNASNDVAHTLTVYARNSRGRGPGVAGKGTPRAVQPARYALYRCDNSSGNSFYTRSSTCEGAGGYTLRGSNWKIATSKVSGTTALYRLYKSGAHVMTVSAAEKDNLVKAGWHLDATIGYVRTSSAYGWTKINRMVKGSFHVFVVNGDVTAWTNRGYAVEGTFYA